MEEQRKLEEQGKRAADFYREFMIFFAVLFFTCVVGIITLLPELEHPYGLLSWGWLSLSVLYFGLLLGIDYSLHVCFHLYKINIWFKKNYKSGFFFPDLEHLVSLVQKISKKVSYEHGLQIIKWFLIVVITLVFIALYLVKLGILH